MNEQNFLRRTDDIISGEGFIREVSIPVSSCLNTGTAVANVSGVLAGILKADNESLVIPFKIPLDYDETKDELVVCVTAELTTGDGVAGSNAMALDLDVIGLVRPGDATKTTISTQYLTDSQNVALTVEEYAFAISGQESKVGDVLSIEVDAQEDGTAEVSIYAVTVKYRSTLSAFTQGRRSEITDVTTND